MKREEIEKVLKEAGVSDEKLKDTVENILAENGKDIKASQDKTAQDKQKELDIADQTIKGLKEKVDKFDGVDVDKLRNDAKEWQDKYDADIAAEKKKTSDLQKEYALKDALRNQGALDPDYIMYKHGGIDKFAFDSQGNPIGLSDILKPMMEASPALFKKDDGDDGATGGAGGFSSGGNHGGGAEPDLDKLSDEEYYKRFEEKERK